LTVTHKILLSRLKEVIDIKENIESRRRPLDVALGQVLSRSEMSDYKYFLDQVKQHRVEMLWLEDRIDLAKCQLSAILNT